MVISRQEQPQVIPSLGSEESRSSSTRASQQDTATPSAGATLLPLYRVYTDEPTQPHPAIPIPNGYVQNNHAPTKP
jgi:hypothetical protein